MISVVVCSREISIALNLFQILRYEFSKFSILIIFHVTQMVPYKRAFESFPYTAEVVGAGASQGPGPPFHQVTFLPDQIEGYIASQFFEFVQRTVAKPDYAWGMNLSEWV